jgi:antitoxin component of MazEF toxin-antitoxin module
MRHYSSIVDVDGSIELSPDLMIKLGLEIGDDVYLTIEDNSLVIRRSFPNSNDQDQ